MARAKNEVIAGDYTGRKVRCTAKRVILDRGFQKPIEVDYTTVSKYEVLDQDTSKSLLSTFGRGLVGNALFGSVGMVAGAMSAKNASIVIMSLEFYNGDRSLLEVDQKVYQTILRALFH